MLVRLLVFLSILFSVQPITAQENREEKIRKVIFTEPDKLIP